MEKWENNLYCRKKGNSKSHWGREETKDLFKQMVKITQFTLKMWHDDT